GAVEHRPALPHAVGIAEAARQPRSLSRRGAARRRSRSRRREIAQEGAASGQARLSRHLALVEIAARAAVLLHLDARVGFRRAAGAALPALPRRARLDGG